MKKILLGIIICSIVSLSSYLVYLVIIPNNKVVEYYLNDNLIYKQSIESDYELIDLNDYCNINNNYIWHDGKSEFDITTELKKKTKLHAVCVPSNDEYIVEDNKGIYNKNIFNHKEHIIFNKVFINDKVYNVEKINKHAFSRTDIEKLEIPKSITTIDLSFQYCTNLKYLFLHQTVTTITNTSFLGSDVVVATSQNSVNYTEDSTNINEIYYNVKEVIEQDGIYYLLRDNIARIIAANNLNNVVLKEFISVNNKEYIVNEIGSCAFYNNTLSSINFDYIKSISTEAFNGCINLKEIYIPKTISHIGLGAFINIRGVKIYTELNQGNSIFPFLLYNNGAIYYNVDKSNFYKEDGITYLLYNNKVHVTNSNNSIVNIKDEVIINNKAYKVESIGQRAFSDSNVVEVYLSDNITQINKYAFSNCELLTKVDLGNNITYIDDYVFEYCELLKELVLPESIFAIGTKIIQKSNIVIKIDMSKEDFDLKVLCKENCLIDAKEIIFLK